MGVMSGIRVVEVATWGFIPSAGVALADWGAQVIKVEHPQHGDPMRGLVPSSLKAAGPDAVSFMFQTFSRGKQSIGLDLKDEGARAALLKLVATADVFLTNYLPGARAKLGIDVEDLRAVNPDLIYVRGSGLGPAGAEADSGGFDLASYWSRGGLAHVSTQEGAPWPPSLPGAAFGDLQAGLYAAGGVAAALFERERTGTARVVDVSLLGAAAWCTAPHIAASSLYDIDMMRVSQHENPGNPISNTYQTADGRFVALVMLESDRFWAPLMRLIGRDDLVADERFATAAARAANTVACVRELEAVFAQRDLAEWTALLSRQQGVWAVVQSPREVAADPQILANGYVRDLQAAPGTSMKVVSAPTQFDGEQPAPTPAPELGADTELLLLESGTEWDDIIALKDRGAIT